MKRFLYSILTLSTLCCGSATAQQWEIGVHAGATGFMGDINPENPLYIKSATGGLFVKRNLNSTWGVQLAYNLVQLHVNDADDSDPYRQSRGRMFTNNVHELALRADFNFFRYIAGSDINRYTPYLFAGMAAIKHKPYVTFQNGGKVSLEDLQLQAENKLKQIAVALPIGAGFKYNIKGPWTIGAEIGYRTVFSNDLDNISNNYPNTDQINLEKSKSIADIPWVNLAFPNGDYETYAGKAIGNGRKRDGYMTAGLTLTFTFIDKGCYWWK